MNSLHRTSPVQRSDDTVQNGLTDAAPIADSTHRLDRPQGLIDLAAHIKRWGRELGFDAIGISDIDLTDAEPGLLSWLEAGYHGEMDYMEKHGVKRARPAELVPGTLRVISVRLPYLPAALLQDSDWREAEKRRLQDPAAAVVSVYARGRDYHKVLRQRLQKLADRIQADIGPFGYRAFTDSAPVMEVELARRAGVGWRGKHTLLLARDAGSFFFIGELYVDLPLPTDAECHYAVPEEDRGECDSSEGAPAHSRATVAERGANERGDATDATDSTGRDVDIQTFDETLATEPALPPADGMHCGQCRRCIDACPTGAIVAPYRLDARRCISYLTIEFKGSIPEPMRAAFGNRIYGCDDCQTACPWNKFAKITPAGDFDTRNDLDSSDLLTLFEWSEADFDRRLEGSAIRRIGHPQWLRNIAIAMGNALRSSDPTLPRQAMIDALQRRADHPSEVVREHIQWALQGADTIR